jgi:hypothetical protein
MQGQVCRTPSLRSSPNVGARLRGVCIIMIINFRRIWPLNAWVYSVINFFDKITIRSMSTEPKGVPSYCRSVGGQPSERQQIAIVPR